MKSDTSHDYYPLKHGVTHEYIVVEITGVVVLPDATPLDSIPPTTLNHRLNIITRTPHANSPQYITSYHDGDVKNFGSIPYFTSYYTTPAMPEFVDSNSLSTSFGMAWDGCCFVPYLGEIGKTGEWFTVPPNPLLPLYPKAGQTLDVHMSTYDNNNVVTLPNWRATLHVLGHYDTWANWKDCWITVLTERESSHVYEYVFARGIGIVDLWHGILSNGVVTGYEYYLTKVIKGKR